MRQKTKDRKTEDWRCGKKIEKREKNDYKLMSQLANELIRQWVYELINNFA